jgi:hypothetical protein
MNSLKLRHTFSVASLLALAAPAPALAHNEPAAGAELGQVILATAMAVAALGVLAFACWRHRTGRGTVLARIAARSERVSGLPGWAALPSFVSALSLNVALLGMYWDIALHIGQGRDAGPLANPAHYLILAGLFGVFAAGCLAVVLPRGERFGPSALRIADNWHAPVGGVLMAACGAFALVGFPLDDMWHRLFGQDVTLWGPTHLMLIGGAGMTLIGQAVLLVEGMRARRAAAGGARPAGASPRFVVSLRRIGIMGGLLVGLSTFQAEFDFGVPQYRFVFQPLLIALAAGVALVAARVWIGRGGALGTVAFFLGLRGVVALIVGPVLGETTPHLPLYLGEALAVEATALLLRGNRPLALGALGGALVGTAGFASEWAWTQVAMPLPWTSELLPEGLFLATLAGVTGGVLGGLLGAGLRGELPRVRVAAPAFAVAVAVIGALVANGLVTTQPTQLRAEVSLTDTRPAPNREALAVVRFDPPSTADDKAWLTVTAWQGGGFVLDRLERVSDGVYRTTRPVPLHGEWKSILRLHRGREVLGVPFFLPEDPAIPARQVSAPARFTRTFSTDHEILQREVKDGIPGWLWTTASSVVLLISLGFVASLAWGVGRIGRTRTPSRAHRERRPLVRTPTPIRA